MAGETVRALLNHVWTSLAPLQNPCALMGGTALAVWNHPRATRDIDLLISVETNDIEKVITCLAAAGCRTKHHPPVRTLGSIRFVQFLYTPPGEFYDAQFDLWLADTELQQSAITRRVSRDLPGLDRPIDVLRCDDLILFKLVADRLIDRADAATLLRENRDQIDFEYVLSWVERLDLTHSFAEVWREAFPGEEPPS